MENFKVNSYYEGLIQNLYGGSRGCFCCFMQFFYQYNRAKLFNENLAECFEELYLLELENCKILSEIIIKIGGDNKYFSAGRKFLSGSNVQYIKKFEDVFLEDIELLEYSILEVKSGISKIEVFRIKQLLQDVLDNKKLELRKLKEDFFKIEKN